MSFVEDMTVATWNTQSIRGARDAKIQRIASALAPHRRDVVALQEIRVGDVAQHIAAALEEIGLTHTHFSGVLAPSALQRTHKKYGNLIASRWPIEPVEWPVSTTWPQLIAAARVTLPAGRFLIVNAHIPNGSGNGWEKVYAFEALAAGLDALREPTILMGDFNEPRSFFPDLTSFGANRHGGLEGSFEDTFGISHARQRWQDAVAAVLANYLIDDDAHWAGRLVTAQLGATNEPTHILRTGAPRYFDHVIATPPFEGRSVTYDHSVRAGRDAISDHSLVFSTLAVSSPLATPCTDP